MRAAANGERLNMVYDYSFLQWMLIFYIYCFLGWCFESTVVSVQQRRFVNRGFLRGPMLPIYGFGATLLLHVSLPLYNHPAALFAVSMLVATIFEYIVGVVMEKLFKVKYWDYSSHRFQFQGRICLQSSLCWGFFGVLLARVIHPPVEVLAVGLPSVLLAVLVALLTIAFAGDVAVSVRTALDLARLLEELDELREQGAALRHELSQTAMVRLTNLSYRVDEARGEWSEKMDDARAQLNERMDDAREQWSDTKEQILDRLDAIQQRFNERAESLKRTRKRMLRGNPSARSAQYDDVLQRLKRHLDSDKKG